MNAVGVPGAGVARGYEALARGDWEAARQAFEDALRDDESPEVLDGLARALWWLRRPEEAVVCRERAYSGFRRDGDLARAARVALWLSREYALVPLFAGLPGDRCHCAHLGYVLAGRVRFTFADGREEAYEAGEAYHAPPGHTPTLYAGTELVEFSPTGPLQETIAVVTRNMAAAAATG